MDEIAQRSATELATMLRTGEIRCVEMLEHFLARVERLNPALNAVVAMNAEAAMEQARAADEALAEEDLWGPLHGVPLTIKDALEVPGMPCTSGAPEFADYMPRHDAVVVQRLCDAGAIVFGKTNVPLYCGDLQTYNEVYGVTNNPWDVVRTPGGSSGGAAAAVAAGLTAFEYGSDIGGSIRTPSHFCGIYGHKPSWGIVPPRGHIPGPPGTIGESDINVVGPLARAPEDLELALQLTAGTDPIHGPVRPAPLSHPAKEKLADFRVAVWVDDTTCPTSAAVADRLQAVADALGSAGVKVDDAARPDFEPATAFGTFVELLMAVIATGFPDSVIAQFAELAKQADPSDMRFQTRAAIGATASHRRWLSANEKRHKIRAKWGAFFEEYDVLLCPVTPTAAIAHDHSPDINGRTISVDGKTVPYMNQTFWAGLVGMSYLPSTVAPIGRTADGLPVGMQIVGPYCGDLITLRFAKLLQEVTEGYVPPPGYG